MYKKITQLLLSHDKVFEQGTDFSSIYKERVADDQEGGGGEYRRRIVWLMVY